MTIIIGIKYHDEVYMVADSLLDIGGPHKFVDKIFTINGITAAVSGPQLLDNITRQALETSNGPDDIYNLSRATDLARRIGKMYKDHVVRDEDVSPGAILLAAYDQLYCVFEDFSVLELGHMQPMAIGSAWEMALGFLGARDIHSEPVGKYVLESLRLAAIFCTENHTHCGGEVHAWTSEKR